MESSWMACLVEEKKEAILHLGETMVKTHLWWILQCLGLTKMQSILISCIFQQPKCTGYGTENLQLKHNHLAVQCSHCLFKLLKRRRIIGWCLKVGLWFRCGKNFRCKSWPPFFWPILICVFYLIHCITLRMNLCQRCEKCQQVEWIIA